MVRIPSNASRIEARNVHHSSQSYKFGLFKLLIFLLVIAGLLILSPSADAGGGPRNVIVIVNQNCPESREIGHYYQQKRGIPIQNMVYLRCSNNERMSATEFEEKVRAPIAVALNRPALRDNIDYIVMTKGTPLRVNYGHYTGDHSVASVLTCVAHPEVDSSLINPYGPIAAMRWGEDAPVRHWRHNIIPGYRFYLVTRLDAFTVQQVKEMIDRSVAASTEGIFLLDKIASASGGYATANERLGTQSGSAYGVLSMSGLPAMCDGTDDLVSNMEGLQGYFSWSYHTPGYSFSKYVSNSFAPGSIGDSYYSYSASTFTEPDNPARVTPLMADLIPNGLTGGAGYVSEPQLSTATYPNVLFERYSAGYNLAESFYAAAPMLYWKTVVFGDPLMAPFATPPIVEILDQDQPLTGLAKIRATAVDDSGISEVEFYFNDSLLGVVTSPPYEIEIDTEQYLIGQHQVEVIAYEDSPVATQGSSQATMMIVNEISHLSHVSQSLQYESGQKVRISSKIVTAGTDQIGDSFYVGEIDRSAGLRVLTGSQLCEGEVVTLVGPVGKVNGERVILHPEELTIEEVGCQSPPPLILLAKDIGAGEPVYSLPGARQPTGLRTIGLLVKVSGKVSAVEDEAFYVDDGSGAYDGSGPSGIRVSARGDPPSLGQFVSVIGISSCDSAGGGIVPVLRMRKSSDLQIIE